MTQPLPDVARTHSPANLLALDWVGMSGIDLSLQLAEPGAVAQVHGRADVAVDLPDPQVKGIHMSRLYRLLDLLGDAPLSGEQIAQTLQDMVASHHDCGSTGARLAVQFDLLCRRPALVTPGLSGWKAYPVQLQGEWRHGVFTLHAQVDVGYSSTCPCSAALARQLVEAAFMAHFAEQPHLVAQQVAEWLREHASLATAHSQRSIARVRIPLTEQAGGLGLMRLVQCIEAALATPLQTAVKRADEQAFAQLNGAHLMYVEDAARNVLQALRADYPQASVSVRHMESLHPHDAVATASHEAQP